MEPRNIGVVLLVARRREARFLEKADRPGEVDGRSISVVTSTHAYKQWAQFCKASRPCSAAAAPREGRRRTRRPSSSTSAGYGPGNFVLAEGGFLLDPVPGEDCSRPGPLFVAMVDAAAPKEP